MGRPAPWQTTEPVVSVGTQVAGLRRLLLDAVGEEMETGRWFRKAADVSRGFCAIWLLCVVLTESGGGGILRDLYL